MKTFDVWLLRRVAQAVEAGEVPADLLADLQAEIEAARDRPQKESHAEAVQDLAERLGIPTLQAEQALAGLEALPTVTRELLMRRIAEAWLDAQRKAYRARDDCSPHLGGAV